MKDVLWTVARAGRLILELQNSCILSVRVGFSSPIGVWYYLGISAESGLQALASVEKCRFESERCRGSGKTGPGAPVNKVL